MRYYEIAEWVFLLAMAVACALAVAGLTALRQLF